MTHVIEPASSARARCRGCGEAIAKDELRLGERLPNPYADGEMTLWFHLPCAACKRPEPLLEALGAAPEVPDRERLERLAREGIAHPRLLRIDGAERSPSSQARCRQCQAPIAKGEWRLRLQFYRDGRFEPGGFVHLGCREPYFESRDVLERALHFSRALGAADRAALRQACDAG